MRLMKEINLQSTESSSDFMKQPLEQLKKMILDYGSFSCTAEKLKWLDMEERYEYWHRSHPICIQLEAFTFPQDYRIWNHMEDVYVQVVLSEMAHYEEWEPGSWDNISQKERRECLEGHIMRHLYDNYATFKELRLVKRDWAFLAKEIRFFADENKVPFSEQKQYLDLFENAAVIELGGLYESDASYWAVKHNLLLVVDCGCWD